MKKSFFYVFIGIVGLISIFSIVFNAFNFPFVLPTHIKQYNQNGYPVPLVSYLVSFCLSIIKNTILSCFCISYVIKAIKGSNASNFVRYTYEEYKEYRENKKAQKQADKKAKLQAELNKMEKAE